ncbi:MAG: DUF1501 domain-containing protein [Marmoricola sp.]
MTDPTCSCPPSCAEFALTRRTLLRTAAVGAGALAATGVFGGAFREVAYGAPRGGNVVVVLSLRGGADGLSLVVPRGADHDLLTAARPATVVPEGALVAGDAAFGLHPAFAPLVPLWQQGRFGAVHAVGLPAPNRSHFAAMAEIEEARPGSTERVGWINRVVGLDRTAPPETAVQIGGALLPTSMAGPAQTLGAPTVTDLDLGALGDTATRRRAGLRQLWAGRTDTLGQAVRGTLDTTARLSGLAAAADTAVHTDRYPDGALREVLANTAALIRADVGTRVVTIDYGDWDMHTGMVDHDADPTAGRMHDQVAHLAASLAAFFADLGTAAGRVTVVTLSEFGRRVAANADRGHDHGHGNVMLLLGGGVRGGTVHGRWPGLASLDDGDLAVRQDFRSVLWEVLASRFPDVGSRRATVFPGLVPESLGTMA